MPSFDNLLIVVAVAFAAPFVLGLFPGVRLPSVVLEIVAGIVIGPSVLGLAEVDQTVSVVALVGLTFVLFLAGLEIELDKLRGPLVRLTGAGFALSFVIAAAVALALRAGVIAAAIAVAGGFVGRALLESWQIPIFALRLTAGLMLFVVAFRLVMQPYEAPAPHAAPEAPGEPPTAGQLVFPMVLTPYGIAAVIALLAMSQGVERTGVIVATLLAVMLLNVVAMAYVRPILATARPVLQALGAVLGVLQVALAVQIILTALHGLRVLPGPT